MSSQVGQVLDLPQIPMTSGKQFNLSDYLGKKVILYFYPKDSTPGCTSESIDFSNKHSDFLQNGSVVFGISKDGLKSHEKFKAKHQMPFELIADIDKQLCNYFGVLKEKSMFGKKYMGIERSTFVIDERGKLAKAWHKVKVSGHVDEVLAYIQSN